MFFLSCPPHPTLVSQITQRRLFSFSLCFRIRSKIRADLLSLWKIHFQVSIQAQDLHSRTDDLGEFSPSKVVGLG